MAPEQREREPVTVLLDAARLRERSAVATGQLLALTESLARDLDPVLERELFIPPEKARMTRRGGRCEVDGSLLEFDPWSPRVHRCPRCGRVFDDDTHYRWWVMWYQLWLAERAVHAAALFAVRGDPRHRDFAASVLDGYADRYLTYPNADNVLGPTRPFFSTYLESIWLLQLVVALDLLEMTSRHPSHASLGQRVRERVIEPSARLIAGYDEGLSNRQVWNNAAMLAAARVLGRRVDDAVLGGPSGLTAHLTSGLLSDGTWYEGENYHLFAHRGLWYGVTMAAAAGIALDDALVARFDEGFATPFMTALPDFTFPSRRDSQYAVSLRQWRFAELAELGLARHPEDRRLSGALATLYDPSVERRDTERSRSTAEAERNTPGTGLHRSDLGWRSLLFALPALPALAPAAPASVLMPGQGLAILRREEGRLYAALDYGHSGAGHGHPDRLNVILVRGHDRWLDDVGTGSYVDPSLHWYRSTLAHNAPLVDGRSQKRVHGRLVAYEDRGAAGWVRATVEDVAPGVRLRRTLVAMPTYVIDELTWEADREVQVDLPFHVDGELTGVAEWVDAVPEGGAELEDGFSFLRDTACARSRDGLEVSLTPRPSAVGAKVFVGGPHVWWRATAFGPPGAPPRPFYFVRATGAAGQIMAVWNLAASLRAVDVATGVRVTLDDGTVHEHTDHGTAWHIALSGHGGRSTLELGGHTDSDARLASDPTADSPTRLRGREPHRVGRDLQRVTFELVERNYRRSELSWREAGKPTAAIAVSVERDALVIVVTVAKRDIHFAPRQDSNPLDNEPADINSDGIQLHLIVDGPNATPAKDTELTYILVPEPGGSTVRVTSRSSGSPAPAPIATWAATGDGYSVRSAFPLDRLGLQRGSRFRLGVIVNDMSADRERRRGQLVLGGFDGEFVYLRGDRLPPDRHLPFVLADA
jgi:hypothetical protein